MFSLQNLIWRALRHLQINDLDLTKNVFQSSGKSKKYDPFFGTCRHFLNCRNCLVCTQQGPIDLHFWKKNALWPCFFFGTAEIFGYYSVRILTVLLQVFTEEPVWQQSKTILAVVSCQHLHGTFAQTHRIENENPEANICFQKWVRGFFKGFLYFQTFSNNSQVARTHAVNVGLGSHFPKLSYLCPSTWYFS